jgi:hypothetical protein
LSLFLSSIGDSGVTELLTLPEILSSPPVFSEVRTDEQKIIDDVEIVFHSAATVRFDEEMK